MRSSPKAQNGSTSHWWGNPEQRQDLAVQRYSGSHEHVGNYSGVTVDAKRGHYNYKGYRFEITDLPGTYALTAYRPKSFTYAATWRNIRRT